MESFFIKLLTLIALGSMFFGLGYYYTEEVAPVCSTFVDKAFIINRSCECKGYEYERKSLGEDGQGRRETVCIGKIESISCSEKQIHNTFETPCPEEDLLEY